MKLPSLTRYPKKPKASASNAVKEKYLKRVAAIDKLNSAKFAAYKKGAELTKRIAGIKQHTKWKIIAPYSRKKSVAVHERRVKGITKRKRRTTKRKGAKRRR